VTAIPAVKEVQISKSDIRLPSLTALNVRQDSIRINTKRSARRRLSEAEDEEEEMIRQLLIDIGFGKKRALKYSKELIANGIETEKKMKQLQKMGKLKSKLEQIIDDKDDVDMIFYDIERRCSTNSRENESSPFFEGAKHSMGKHHFVCVGHEVRNVSPLRTCCSETPHGMFTGEIILFKKKTALVIKVGDGRRDISREIRMFQYLSDLCDERRDSGCILMYHDDEITSPPYMVLESFGTDIRAYLKTPTGAKATIGLYLRSMVAAVKVLHDLNIM